MRDVRTGRVRRPHGRAAALFALVFIFGLRVDVAAAHHSFAVFFDTDKGLIKVVGVVKEFHFTNPHGVVTLAVNESGHEVIWRAETNSPSILRRRGWTADSLHVGEKVTLEGWRARDGSKYIRLRSATRANGEAVGTAPTPVHEQ